MTNKQLIKILRKMPKNALININNEDFTISFQVSNDGKQVVTIKNNSVKQEKSFDKLN